MQKYDTNKKIKKQPPVYHQKIVILTLILWRACSSKQRLFFIINYKVCAKDFYYPNAIQMPKL